MPCPALFRDDDAGYLAWLVAHSECYVLNIARNYSAAADLGQRRIVLRALGEGVDTGTPTGRAVAAMMATLAEFELELGRERRAASRDSRRARLLPATKPSKADRRAATTTASARGDR